MNSTTKSATWQRQLGALAEADGGLCDIEIDGERFEVKVNDALAKIESAGEDVEVNGYVGDALVGALGTKAFDDALARKLAAPKKTTAPVMATPETATETKRKPKAGPYGLQRYADIDAIIARIKDHARFVPESEREEFLEGMQIEPVAMRDQWLTVGMGKTLAVNAPAGYVWAYRTKDSTPARHAYYSKPVEAAWSAWFGDGARVYNPRDAFSAPPAPESMHFICLTELDAYVLHTRGEHAIACDVPALLGEPRDTMTDTGVTAQFVGSEGKVAVVSTHLARHVEMVVIGEAKPGESEYAAKVQLGDAAPKQWGCNEYFLGQADVEGGALVYVAETLAQAVALHTAVCGTFAGVTEARWIRGPLSRLLGLPDPSAALDEAIAEADVIDANDISRFARGTVDTVLPPQAIAALPPELAWIASAAWPRGQMTSADPDWKVVEERGCGVFAHYMATRGSATVTELEPVFSAPVFIVGETVPDHGGDRLVTLAWWDPKASNTWKQARRVKLKELLSRDSRTYASLAQFLPLAHSTAKYIGQWFQSWRTVNGGLIPTCDYPKIGWTKNFDFAMPATHPDIDVPSGAHLGLVPFGERDMQLRVLRTMWAVGGLGHRIIILAAAAAPFVSWHLDEGFLVQLYGDSTSKKTTALTIAGLLYGYPPDGRGGRPGYGVYGGASPKALLQLAGDLRNLPLIVDETTESSNDKRSDRESVAQVVYELAAGSPARKLTQSGAVRQQPTFATITLLSAETPLLDEREARRGQLTRVFGVDTSPMIDTTPFLEWGDTTFDGEQRWFEAHTAHGGHLGLELIQQYVSIRQDEFAREGFEELRRQCFGALLEAGGVAPEDAPVSAKRRANSLSILALAELVIHQLFGIGDGTIGTTLSYVSSVAAANVEGTGLAAARDDQRLWEALLEELDLLTHDRVTITPSHGKLFDATGGEVATTRRKLHAGIIAEVKVMPAGNSEPAHKIFVTRPYLKALAKKHGVALTKGVEQALVDAGRLEPSNETPARSPALYKSSGTRGYVTRHPEAFEALGLAAEMGRRYIVDGVVREWVTPPGMGYAAADEAPLFS